MPTMRLIIYLFLSVVLIASPACLHPKPAKIMSWKEYSRLSYKYKWPYIIRTQSSKGKLLYVGATHSYSPAEPQVSEIEALWAEFRPNIAFNEGGDPPVANSVEEAVSKYGEAGLVRFLASRDKVPVASIDPPRAEQFAFLSAGFLPEQVKLYFVLLSVAQHIQKGRVDTVDQELKANVFPYYAGLPGFNISPNSIVELEASYSRYLRNQRGYKETPMSWFDPTRSENFLNEMSRQLNNYRDEYMVDLLTRQVREGLRVFAVAGGTHVVMQERAIRNTIR